MVVQRTKITRRSASKKKEVTLPVPPMETKVEEMKVEMMTPPVSIEKNGGKIQWRKTGRGRLRLVSGELIDRPNQLFWARPDEVSPAFRDTVKPVEGELPPEVPLEVVSTEYIMKETPVGSGNFEILDGQGKIVNEAPLTAKQAEEMLKSLQEE